MTIRRGRDLRDPDELRRLRDLHQRRRLGLPEPGRPRGGFVGILVLGLVVLVLTAGLVAAGLTVLRPVVRVAVVGWAGDNPSALRIPVVADLVAEDIGSRLTLAASSDQDQTAFTVVGGDTAADIAERLEAGGLLLDRRAFVYWAVQKGVEARLEAGDYVLRRNMTPEALVGALLLAQDPVITITFREGLRLEQMTAKLATLPVRFDPAEFYRLAKEPPASLLATAPWLTLPEGASLEGFLFPDTYTVLADTSAEELLRILLARFREVVGDARIQVPKERGLSFYEVVTLASIVEQEVIVPDDAPLVAGVYQNRLTKGMMLQSDPTIMYGHDSVELGKLPVERWVEYVFWAPFNAKYADVVFPKALRGYQSYKVVGLTPTPICTPTIMAIDAALAPNTKAGYYYFVAKNDGSKRNAFAKTYAQHLKNLKKYGY